MQGEVSDFACTAEPLVLLVLGWQNGHAPACSSPFIRQSSFAQSELAFQKALAEKRRAVSRVREFNSPSQL